MDNNKQYVIYCISKQTGWGIEGAALRTYEDCASICEKLSKDRPDNIYFPGKVIDNPSRVEETPVVDEINVSQFLNQDITDEIKLAKLISIRRKVQEWREELAVKKKEIKRRKEEGVPLGICLTLYATGEGIPKIDAELIWQVYMEDE